jgi:Tfp pilus assembly PilM family ATPase
MSAAANCVRALLSTPGPAVGIEIALGRVSGVVLERSRRGLVVAAHATEALPDGAVKPAINDKNIADPAAVTDAIRRVFRRLERRPTRVALVIPDAAAKVSLVRFDTTPPRAADLEQLIRWQVRKAAPFRIEDAQVAFTPGSPVGEKGREFVVVLVRRDIVEAYEQVAANAGAHAGVVDLASFNLINVALAGGPLVAGGADWLLIHVASDSSTLAIVRGEHLIFFRNRPADAEGDLVDLVHQTAMYYEDRLEGRGFTRAILACEEGSLDGQDGGALRRTLADRLRTEVQTLDLQSAATLTDRISARPELVDALAAAIGVLISPRW